MRGAIPLLPPTCLRGMDGANYTFTTLFTLRMALTQYGCTAACGCKGVVVRGTATCFGMTPTPKCLRLQDVSDKILLVKQGR
jgi:hypothetical protein